jgi:uncharacterized protein DUF6884
MTGHRLSVALVACSATKATGPQPARLLYTSQLFRAASAYAERTYDYWFVISARHYLVHPDERLAPYDTRLDSLNLAGRQHWARTVVADLRLGHGARTDGRLDWPADPTLQLRLGRWFVAGDRVDLWMHAGAAYTEPITEAAAGLPFDIHTPLKGLGIGQQLAWYAQQQKPASPA